MDQTIPAPIRELTPRVHAAALAGVGDLAPSTMRIANARYTDPAIALAERRTTFSEPLLLTPSSAVAEPGSFLTLDLLGTSVIVVRGGDGRIRALLNACRHRGATLTEGSGCVRRFTCSYHNWIYDTDGSLTGIPDRRRGFSDVDPATHGLVEFPSEERHGFVWATLNPGGALDLGSHLGPLDAELAAWGLDYEVAATITLQIEANWKCALEAFQETYHFPYVHSESLVGRGTISNIVTFDQLGRHHRLGVPHRTIGTDPQPAPGENISIIYYIYPFSVIATSPLGGELLQFYPGPNPATSTVRHTVLSRFPVADEGVAAFFEDYTPQIQGVVRDEDAIVLARSGRGLAAGRTDVVLGRNEIGCQAAHRQLLADLASLDDTSALGGLAEQRTLTTTANT
ncbi:aromatic ring-hydroxylating dioxygenase subunit alpha [Frankia sp. AgB1.9]|uniref:aromatic ring-hydroxylating oxygenase subunit alpha n=1 Tax=unclassified Frankia TaxID=2632575 RepID=UPI0019313073|nr:MULTISPECIES: aromatic ring-hydroxylating dioxygenase subunit alpha [unclassified Frankia]MBL7487569.1 aromatic ring-hydroxylating dioxygenase subunit alpha [Frankia sp. AgW1.1]MBL7549541.1 aromatic ring-hydroxylating dioxygenase subunit alpha [Frankia sp. AgB1.9]MBL7620670.1 aromatic ring-hydroxylating dioxygenase subunit alpha [Frankia sp. AgB1.8]